MRPSENVSLMSCSIAETAALVAICQTDFYPFETSSPSGTGKHGTKFWNKEWIVFAPSAEAQSQESSLQHQQMHQMHVHIAEENTVPPQRPAFVATASPQCVCPVPDVTKEKKYPLKPYTSLVRMKFVAKKPPTTCGAPAARPVLRRRLQPRPSKASASTAIKP